MPKPATVKAVVAYAEQLRAQADREAAADPWFQPYRPTEAAARKLTQRLGPEAALDHLRRRAAMTQANYREDERVATASLQRHTARRSRIDAQRDKRRAALPSGVRIDQAIARLSTVASPAAGSTEPGIHGGDVQAPAPPFTVDASDKARRLALKCAQQIEALEDEVRLRDLDRAA